MSFNLWPSCLEWSEVPPNWSFCAAAPAGRPIPCGTEPCGSAVRLASSAAHSSPRAAFAPLPQNGFLVQRLFAKNLFSGGMAPCCCGRGVVSGSDWGWADVSSELGSISAGARAEGTV